MPIGVNIEIGEIEGVVVNMPGLGAEEITPDNSEGSFYCDILNLGIVSSEHAQFEEVTEHHTNRLNRLRVPLIKEAVSEE